MHSHEGQTALGTIQPRTFGYRSEFITDTRGLGIMNSIFWLWRTQVIGGNVNVVRSWRMKAVKVIYMVC